jgi:hypothetical protein
VEQPGVEQPNRAKLNFFDTPDGLVVPITFAGGTSVSLRLEQPGRYPRAEVLLPGERTWQPLTLTNNTLNVPIRRGCALLRLR